MNKKERRELLLTVKLAMEDNRPKPEEGRGLILKLHLI
jgi:hypothetical protein